MAGGRRLGFWRRRRWAGQVGARAPMAMVVARGRGKKEGHGRGMVLQELHSCGGDGGASARPYHARGGVVGNSRGGG